MKSEQMDAGVGAPAPSPEQAMSNDYILVPFCKDSCKYCLGRGQERWLSARHAYSDGSKDEEFELRPCRRTKYEIRRKP